MVNLTSVCIVTTGPPYRRSKTSSVSFFQDFFCSSTARMKPSNPFYLRVYTGSKKHVTQVQPLLHSPQTGGCSLIHCWQLTSLHWGVARFDPCPANLKPWELGAVLKELLNGNVADMELRCQRVLLLHSYWKLFKGLCGRMKERVVWVLISISILIGLHQNVIWPDN